MVSAREAGYAIYGAWRLARFDATGLEYFDNTVEAFWRSFWAAAIVLPGYALLILLRLMDAPVAVGPLTAIVVEGIAYVAGWVAFPLAMFYVAQFVDRADRYYRYIAAYNWAVVLQVTLLLVLTALAASGILPDGLSQLLMLAGTIAILTYQWFIARTALDTTAGGAAGIVLLDLVLGVTINIWAYRILMAGAPLTQTG